MKKLITIILLIIGAFVLFKDKSVAPTEFEVETYNNESVEAPTARELNIEANNFSFSTRAISVNKGDTIKINFKDNVGMHNFRLDEFGVATKVLKAGESETITFVADKIGEFEYYCSVGTHRAMGMIGKLIVN